MNPLQEIPKNKFAQLIVGVATILVAAKLYFTGWFSASLFESTGVDGTGYGTAAGIVPVLIDAVCFVGLSMMSLVSLIVGNIGPVFGGLAGWVSEARETGSSDSLPAIDPAKLLRALESIESRLSRAEEELGIEHGDVKLEDMSKEELIALLHDKSEAEEDA